MAKLFGVEITERRTYQYAVVADDELGAEDAGRQAHIYSDQRPFSAVVADVDLMTAVPDGTVYDHNGIGVDAVELASLIDDEVTA